MVIIVDEQDAGGRSAVRLCRHAVSLSLVGLRLRLRHIEPDDGAAAQLAIDCHAAAGLPGKAIDHAEPEASAFAGFLGREERLEGTIAGLLAHPGAGISEEARNRAFESIT